MKLGLLLGVGIAFALHVAFVLFGGVFFRDDGEDHGTLQEVELVAEDEAEEEEEKPVEPSAEAIESESEAPPETAELTRDLDLSEVSAVPELEALSLNAIESALRGEALGGGDFAQALDFTSGGRIGGTGKAGGPESAIDQAFSLSEIDQKPRVVFQSEPVFPAEMRGKKVEGVVTVAFVVDPAGKVDRPRVERSTHPAFDKPAVDAVKQWKFEPAVKGGQRVPCKMRIPIRFQPRTT